MNISKSLFLSLTLLIISSVDALHADAIGLTGWEIYTQYKGPVIHHNYLNYFPNYVMHARVGDIFDLDELYTTHQPIYAKYNWHQRGMNLCDVWELSYDAGIIQRYESSYGVYGQYDKYYPRIHFKAIRPGKTMLSFGATRYKEQFSFTIIVE